MGRLSPADRAWLRDATDRLRTYDPDRADALAWLVPALHERTGCMGTAVYAVEERAGTLGLAFGRFMQSDVAGERVFAKLDSWLRSKNRGLGVYDPKRPAAAQRGRLIVMPAPSAMVAGAALPRGAEPRAARQTLRRAVEEVLRPCGWDRPLARILLCEGPRLVAWFGQAERREFTHRQRALLRAVAAPLQRRLLLEESLQRSAIAMRALEAMLELLPVPAFVVSARRVILHANTVARVALGDDQTLSTALCARGGPDSRRFEVTRLPTDATCHYLVLARVPVGAIDARVADAARHWGMTARESEVLLNIARGASNRRIAVELSCADRTVEIHVSRILAKANVESRAALIAKILERSR